MIILAAAIIILSISGSDISGKANEAVSSNDLATAKEIISVARSEWELNYDELTAEYENFGEYAKERLNKAGIDYIDVTEDGKILDGSETVAISVWDGTIATAFASGTGNETDPYIIDTASELAYLAQYCNSGFEISKGKYFKLTSNIDLNNLLWTPIGNGPSYYFGGIFDGQNYFIKNINVKNSEFAGLFGFAGHY